MFGRSTESPEPIEPEGRYYVELVEGAANLGAFGPRGQGTTYDQYQRILQQRVQAALNHGSSRGWDLVNVVSPAASLSSAEGTIGCMSPTLLIWDTRA
jgi:hypothetical protein